MPASSIKETTDQAKALLVLISRGFMQIRGSSQWMT